MPETPSRFFELAAEHGRDHADNLQPLTQVGVSMPVVRMIHTAKGERIPSVVSHSLAIDPADRLEDALARIIPDTRIIETASPQVASALLACGQYQEIDQPSKKQLAAAEKETKAHKAALQERDKAVAAGELPAPDSDDPGAISQTTPTGAVSIPGAPVVMTADQRMQIDAMIANGDMLSDYDLQNHVAETNMDDLLAEVDGDPLKALRVYIAEADRYTARSTLLAALKTIIDQPATPGEGD